MKVMPHQFAWAGLYLVRRGLKAPVCDTCGETSSHAVHREAAQTFAKQAGRDD